MKLAPEKVRAYLETRYSVNAAAGIITINATKADSVAAALLKTSGVASAAFITAHNPTGIKTDAVNNARSYSRLVQDVTGRWQFMEGEGAHPTSGWPAEPGLFVLGIRMDDALALGRKHRQHVILFCNGSERPALYACEPEGQSNLDDMVAAIMEPPSFSLATSPGMIKWTRNEDGSFSFRHGMLGGSGSGVCDVESVADRIASSYMNPDRDDELIIYNELVKLGWQDVLVRVKQLQWEAGRVERTAAAAELKDQIKELTRFIRKHRGWTYEQYRNLAYAEHVAANGGKVVEGEVSVRRLHMAAQYMQSAPERLQEAKNELSELEGVKATG